LTKTDEFEKDLNILLSKLIPNTSQSGAKQLTQLKDHLVELHNENIVKINHSVMELVCAKPLIEKGYEVKIEHPLEDGLTCDLYATKGDGSFIVEIETGFVPPEHALDPQHYIEARIASKVIRYSHRASKFALGMPPHYLLQFPTVFGQPPRTRRTEDLKTIKSLCDLYYQNPPVTLEEIKNARIHVIYIIDVDGATIQEVEPEAYSQKVESFLTSA
jgi:hypothetical protein